MTRINGSFLIDRAQADLTASSQSRCGRVATIKINKRIHGFFDESVSLFQDRESSPEVMAEKVDLLKKEVAKVWYNHGLSPKNYRTITATMTNLQNLSSSTKSVITKIEAPTTPPDHDDGDVAIELCEIANLLYQGRFDGAVKIYNQLPSSKKARLEEHCLEIEAEPLKESRESNNTLRFIQALIGYATELAQGEGIYHYPSLSEVRMMFEEAQSYS